MHYDYGTAAVKAAFHRFEEVRTDRGTSQSPAALVNFQFTGVSASSKEPLRTNSG